MFFSVFMWHYLLVCTFARIRMYECPWKGWEKRRQPRDNILIRRKQQLYWYNFLPTNQGRLNVFKYMKSKKHTIISEHQTHLTNSFNIIHIEPLTSMPATQRPKKTTWRVFLPTTASLVFHKSQHSLFFLSPWHKPFALAGGECTGGPGLSIACMIFTYPE